MPRLSIDVTAQEHQQLKALAALKGQSIKEFVLSRTLQGTPDLSGMSEDEALKALMNVLKPRIHEARSGETVTIPKGRLLDHVKGRVNPQND